MTSRNLVKTNSENQLENLDYQVLHSTEGRIRIRIPKLWKDTSYATKLESSILSLDFVTEVSINPKAMSIVINYEPDAVSNADIEQHLVMAMQQASSPTIAPHSTSSLAKRLGVTFQALNWHRSQTNFPQWSRSRDPEHISWTFDAASKSFCPVVYNQDSSMQKPSKGLQVLQAVKEAVSAVASGKIGAMLGKFAGEVIGLILLGSAGMVMGAEVGTYLGEIIGIEIGRFAFGDI
jgi:copper chaperone CopZ